jgi:adhesin HecA-like repeat protein
MRNFTRVALCLILGSVVNRIAVAAPVLSVQPSHLTAMPGQVFSLGVWVTGVADLYAFQFDLTFDPAVLRAGGVAEGPFLSSGGTTAFVPGTIDNNSGTISATAGTLLGVLPGVSGDGALAMIDFTVLELGIRPVTLTGGTLLDSSLSGIAFTMQPAVVAAVPEPHSSCLAAAGLGVLLTGIRIGKRTTASS